MGFFDRATRGERSSINPCSAVIDTLIKTSVHASRLTACSRPAPPRYNAFVSIPSPIFIPPRRDQFLFLFRTNVLAFHRSRLFSCTVINELITRKYIYIYISIAVYEIAWKRSPWRARVKTKQRKEGYPREGRLITKRTN